MTCKYSTYCMMYCSKDTQCVRSFKQCRIYQNALTFETSTSKEDRERIIQSSGIDLYFNINNGKLESKKGVF